MVTQKMPTIHVDLLFYKYYGKLCKNYLQTILAE